MTTPPRRRPLPTVAVGEGVLVLDPDARRAHGLNRSAAAIWEACDGRRTAAAIAATLAAEAGAAVDAVAADVSATLDGLAAEGLLEGSRPRPPEQEPVPAGLDPDSPRDAPTRTAPRHLVGTATGLGTGAEIRCDDAEVARFLGRVLGPLLGRDPGPGHHHYELRGTGSPAVASSAAVDLLTVLDGRVVDRPRDRRSQATTFLWHLNQLLTRSPGDQLRLHAAAASWAGRGVVLPGDSGAGKSTLVAALVRGGFAYLTDETAEVALGPDGPVVRPYPKWLNLRRGSWPLLHDLRRAAPVEDPLADPTAWQLDVSALRPGAVGDTAPLAVAVLPRHVPGGRAEPERLPPLEAAVALAGCSFNLVGLASAGVEQLAVLAERIPTFRLDVDELDAAVAAVRNLVDPATTVAYHDRPGGSARSRDAR